LNLFAESISVYRLVLGIGTTAPVLGRGIVHKGQVLAKHHVHHVADSEDHRGGGEVRPVVRLIGRAVCGEQAHQAQCEEEESDPLRHGSLCHL